MAIHKEKEKQRPQASSQITLIDTGGPFLSPFWWKIYNTGDLDDFITLSVIFLELIILEININNFARFSGK